MMGLVRRFGLNFVPIMLFSLVFANLSSQTASFTNIYWCLFISVGLNILVSLCIDSSVWQARLRYVLELGIKAYVSFSFMIYGAAKLSKNQFSDPEAFSNRLLGHMELSEVAWVFFSSSFPYVVFIGLGQVLGALLLCFRRTTLLAASLLFVIGLNVVLVNFFYDISVKLFSSVLLVMVVYLLMLETPRLWSFFLGRSSVKPRTYVAFPELRWFKVMTLVLHVLLVVFIVVIPLGMILGN